MKAALAKIWDAEVKLEVERKEKVDLLNSLEFVAVEAMLKTRADLMIEYKAGQHTQWDPNGDIDIWHQIEAELEGQFEGAEGEDLEDNLLDFTEDRSLIQPSSKENLLTQTSTVGDLPEDHISLPEPQDFDLSWLTFVSCLWLFICFGDTLSFVAQAAYYRYMKLRTCVVVLFLCLDVSALSIAIGSMFAECTSILLNLKDNNKSCPGRR